MTGKAGLKSVQNHMITLRLTTEEYNAMKSRAKDAESLNRFIIDSILLEPKKEESNAVNITGNPE